jgi:cytochrome bd-type quinol oxidase subunit 2
MMVAANEMRAARERSRRQLALILFVLGSLVVLITPAVWVVADDLFEGEHFQDPPTLAVSLVVTFISTIFAALIVTWRSRQSRGREEL